MKIALVWIAPASVCRPACIQDARSRTPSLRRDRCSRTCSSCRNNPCLPVRGNCRSRERICPSCFPSTPKKRYRQASTHPDKGQCLPRSSLFCREECSTRRDVAAQIAPFALNPFGVVRCSRRNANQDSSLLSAKLMKFDPAIISPTPLRPS